MVNKEKLMWREKYDDDIKTSFYFLQLNNCDSQEIKKLSSDGSIFINTHSTHSSNDRLVIKRYFESEERAREFCGKNEIKFLND